MSQKSLEQINREIAEFLVKKHFAEREKGIEFYFVLMQDRHLFRDGGQLPFLQDENKISLSFWKCSSGYKEDYRLRIDIYEDGLIQFLMVKDSRLTDSDVLEIQTFLATQEESRTGSNAFVQILTRAHEGNVILYLDEFIENDKIAIDTWVLGLFSKKQKNRKHSSNQDLTDNYESNELYAQIIRPAHFDSMLRDYLQMSPISVWELADAIPEISPLSNAITGFGIWNYRGIRHAKIKEIPIDLKTP